jgi:hypothetical protein
MEIFIIEQILMLKQEDRGHMVLWAKGSLKRPMVIRSGVLCNVCTERQNFDATYFY